MAFILYFRKAFSSVSSWSAFLRHLVHQRSLTRLAQAGERGAGLLRPPSHSPFKGKRCRFNLSCTMFCYIAATIWQLRFLCLLLSDRGRNYQSIVSYFRAVWNDALVTAWWKLTYSLMKDTGSKVDRPFIIQSLTADAKFLPWFLRCCFYIQVDLYSHFQHWFECDKSGFLFIFHLFVR